VLQVALLLFCCCFKFLIPGVPHLLATQQMFHAGGASGCSTLPANAPNTEGVWNGCTLPAAINAMCSSSCAPQYAGVGACQMCRQGNVGHHWPVCSHWQEKQMIPAWHIHAFTHRCQLWTFSCQHIHPSSVFERYCRTRRHGADDFDARA